jgi:hypothetical protein
LTLSSGGTRDNNALHSIRFNAAECKRTLPSSWIWEIVLERLLHTRLKIVIQPQLGASRNLFHKL